MTETTKTIFEKYQIRKSKKQKSDFRDCVKSIAYGGGYKFSIERGKMGADNIVIGDVSRAKVVYTAHYDTCPILPFPNFITPKNFLIYLLYQIFITCIFLLVPMLIIGSAFLAVAKNAGLSEDVTGVIYLVIYYLILIAFLFFMMAGPANKHTANDNTSGVTTLIDIMNALPDTLKDDVAFIFFDLEESGLFGSKSFYAQHKSMMKDKLLVNFDCVSDGENILIVVNKKARHYTEYLKEAFIDTKNIHVEVAEKGVFYPSDQASFPCGIGVASLKYSKMLKTYYMDKIHTNKDTVYREENIEFLTAGAINLADILTKQ
ncbi:MAG: Zn-dependent exopeptidase M28 [Ruminococcaceae bacterium]|nr:Zn-dependent exopeptidase M28 [Oscillospiraceae bacterium]